MSDWYYDNVLEPLDESSSFARIERVYCLNWQALSETQCAELLVVYASLPGWVADVNEATDPSLPYWFGCDEDHPPFLWLSAEPSGLQVHGVLKSDDWLRWDTMFREGVSGLPRFEC